MKNWKMFGLTIKWVTIIPCYYDWLRYFRKAKKYFRNKGIKIQYKTIWHQWSCLYDTTLTKL